MKKLLTLLPFLWGTVFAQEDPAAEGASVSTSIGGDGTGKIVVEAHGELPKPAVFYTTTAEAKVQVGTERIEQEIRLGVKVIQGDAETLTFGLSGSGEVSAVEGDQIQSWSVRKEGDGRFLDLRLKENVTEVSPLIRVRSGKLKIPSAVDLTHLTPGKAVGFNSTISISYSSEISGKVMAADGFLPVDSNGPPNRYQTATGGRINLSLNRGDATPGPVELSGTSLEGEVHPDGNSVVFKFAGNAEVTEADSAITILRGSAAVTRVPASANYRLRLTRENGAAVYKLEFPEAGNFPVTLDFVARLSTPQNDSWTWMDFTVAGGAVVPLRLSGLDEDFDFWQDTDSVVPMLEGGDWLGFLPATGRAFVRWKPARKTGEGKLFFTTAGKIEVQVGAGLMRQNHQIDYTVLQGELEDLTIGIDGEGEILDVQGGNIVGWSVTGEGDARQIEVKLSQPITDTAQLLIRTQTPLDAFPVRVTGLRLTPEGAIRHSGFIRLVNEGSVRLEPAALVGLTQLAPEQFPGDAIEARQVFVYRFPAAEHGFEVAANRIQPEVNVSEIVVYQLAETDRVINANIELDIREAPIREWDIMVPEDYSVAEVTGAGVADYVKGSEVEGGQRTLKIIFSQDVSGRQLINLLLEKNEAAAAGDWVLPRLGYPDAKSVRGDIGIAGAPGFRIVAGEMDLLVEKPLSYFPNPVPDLQQAFRIREPGWSATMQIELLEKSIQADVFHLYSLSEGTAFASVLLNYFVTGAPVSEWEISVPADLENVIVEGQYVRGWAHEEGTLRVSLHQPVIGPYTLLVTTEEKLDSNGDVLQAGRIAPAGVQGERGYLQVVSPLQVNVDPPADPEGLLTLDPLELPAEFRLLSSAPPLGTWQYTERPFQLTLNVNWFEPGTTVTQVVEYSEVVSRVSTDGELVTEILYYVKSRGQGALRLQLPSDVRLWAVTVEGRSVTARRAENATLIPLPGGTDPNIPVVVGLQIGRTAVDGNHPSLVLPMVSAPVLKTNWNVHGDRKHVLVPSGGTVDPPEPVLRPTGFAWLTRSGITALLLIALATAGGAWLTRTAGWLRFAGLILLGAAIFGSVLVANEASFDSGDPAPLQLSLPVLTPEESVELQIQNVPVWMANLSWLGILAIAAGIVCVVASFTRRTDRRILFRIGGALLIGLGILLQRDSAPWFFGVLAVAIFLLLFVPGFRNWFGGARRGCGDWLAARRERKKQKKESETPPADTGTATASILIGALLVSAGMGSAGAQTITEGFSAANAIQQEWEIRHEEKRLHGRGTVQLSGKPGDRFILLKAPAVLTKFEGEGLRLTKRDMSGVGLIYIVSVPAAATPPAALEDPFAEAVEPAVDSSGATDFEATFEFQLEVPDVTAGFPLPTGPAAVQEIQASYDRGGWEFASPAAVKIDPVLAAGASEQSEATIVLLPHEVAQISMKPIARDVTMEDTQFFVEASNLYVPGPGVVDGRHRIHIRPSQGQVSDLSLKVPEGLTVSEVSGPIGSWQFDADSRVLALTIEPAQSAVFDVLIDTQRGLDPLPAEVILAPLKVGDAAGEVGLVAIAFGPDAQPERADSDTMSAVNLGDFEAGLLPNDQTVIHRVFRYGAEGGTLDLRVAPVASEVRVTSKQVLSLGDERIVLGINFAAEITRAGLFQLSFPLPDGLEVESLSGGALHHWAELTEDGQRQIILHLNGKTIGPQQFTLSLTGPAPDDTVDWEIPRFELNEATRQTGDLVVKPTTGIRLETVSRVNVSEVDPRTLGGEARGALAFRLLQQDWDLVLDIEKQDPRVTGQILHEITLREGQTRSALLANFNVQNASIRSLQVALPISDENEIRTLRATGKAVADLVRTAADSNVWEIQFKRRVVGDVQVRIEYERRGDRVDDTEILTPAGFPEARQLSYHFAVRAGGRLELETGEFPRGWQQADWNSVSPSLREAGNRNAPALTLRAIAPEEALNVMVRRHSLAEALKLRVAGGALVTVLSPLGNQLTSVDLTVQVIQRSSLTVGLPVGGELFSIFVNGESVHSVREGDSWKFYILPGADDRTAHVRFVYAVPGDRLSRVNLSSPQLNVPLENIHWHVMAPKGFELTGDAGNLELTEQQFVRNQEDPRNSYLSKVEKLRRDKEQRANERLDQANQFLQAGDQKRAQRALSSVANQYALDAASNEDARVQLENLQTQQAFVGLNTRRQRLYLDYAMDESVFAGNDQLKQGAAANPVLQRGELNFRPQEISQLLQGNTKEDNAVLQRMGSRLVRHQRTTDPAPQAITITLPEEGTVYSFTRTVQVAENAALELDLTFARIQRLGFWRTVLVLVLLAALAGGIVYAARRRRTVQ